MKILHTADVHLRRNDDDRWAALQAIVDLGKLKNIDLLAISGDLFDSRADARTLHAPLRRLFAKAGFRTCLIAGNHDADAFPEGAFLGEDVTVIRSLTEPLRLGGIWIWGLPYRDLPEESILEQLHLAAKEAPDPITHVLLYHGDLLDLAGGAGDYGDEGRRRYMPVKLAYFAELPWDYVLAGPPPARFDVRQYRAGGYFVYPGSPIAITRREHGERHVNLFHLGNAPAPHAMQTPHYRPLTITLDPFSKIDPVATVARHLRDLELHVRILLSVDGYFDGERVALTETELHNALTDLPGERVELVQADFRDIRDLRSDDLLRRCVERLDAMDLPPENRGEVVALLIRAMMETQP